MTARILRFPIAPQEPAMPAIDHDANEYPRGMTIVLVVAMALSSASVVGMGIAAWRFFHG